MAWRICFTRVARRAMPPRPVRLPLPGPKGSMREWVSLVWSRVIRPGSADCARSGNHDAASAVPRPWRKARRSMARSLTMYYSAPRWWHRA